MCCGYGDAGAKNGFGFDCLIIPGAQKKTAAGNNIVKATFDEFCGGGTKAKASGFFLGTTMSVGGLTNAQTATASSKFFPICTNKLPFMVSFFSDNGEFAGEIGMNPITNMPTKNNRGFRLQYMLQNCN